MLLADLADSGAVGILLVVALVLFIIGALIFIVRR